MVGLLDRFFGSKKTEPRQMDAKQAEIVVNTAQDIVAAFGDVLAIPSGMVRAVDELPYSKEQIKTAVAFLLKLTNDSQSREHLKVAYISLSSFQPINREQRQALQEWDAIFAGAELPGVPADVAPETIVKLGRTTRPLQNAVGTEMAALRRELESQGLW